MTLAVAVLKEHSSSLIDMFGLLWFSFMACPTRVLDMNTKQSDGEAPVILNLWGMQSTPSLPLLPGPLWPGVVAPNRVLSMGQTELNCVLMLNWIVWNRTVLTFNCV